MYIIYLLFIMVILTWISIFIKLQSISKGKRNLPEKWSNIKIEKAKKISLFGSYIALLLAVGFIVLTILIAISNN